MTSTRRKLGALLGVVAIGIAVASTAGAARETNPCATKAVASTCINIGGTFPLTDGPYPGVSLYKTIAAAEQAYYGYVNAHGGVNGRKINDIVKDDQYVPSETYTKTKQLVESDHIFADVGSLGTATSEKVMGYLNNKGIPQALLATGDAYWGLCALPPSSFKPIKNVCTSRKPWTEGWQPDYPGEAKIYAKYILAHVSHPKIGVLYQSDDYGKNYLAGLQGGLGSHKSDIVDAEAYTPNATSAVVGADVGKLEAHGANTVVIFATPAASIAALATEGALHWTPSGGTFLNNVSANRLFILSAQGAGASVNGVISSTYIKSQTATPGDSAMLLAKQVIDGTNDNQLKGDFAIGDNNLIYGMAVAWTFVDALKHAGKNPTRASLMSALRSLNEGANKNPFVYPGMVVKSSSTRLWPMQQLQLEKWGGQTNSCNPNTGASCGDWKTFAGIYNSGH